MDTVGISEFMSLQHPSSVLALACMAAPPLFMTGCEDGAIRVYHSESLTLARVVTGRHKRGISSLRVHGGFLFSASRDAACVWDVEHDFALTAVVPGLPRSGAMLSLTAIGRWLLVGSQSSRILAHAWRAPRSATSGAAAAASAVTGAGGKTNDANGAQPRGVKRKAQELSADGAEAGAGAGAAAAATAATDAAQAPGDWSVHDAHNGYVYCLAAAVGDGVTSRTLLFSGGGDGRINVWTPGRVAPKLGPVTPRSRRRSASIASRGSAKSNTAPTVDSDAAGGAGAGVSVKAESGAPAAAAGGAPYCLSPCGSLQGHTGAVFALLLVGQELWSCSQDRTVRVWDTETLHCRRVLEAHQDEVLCLSCAGEAPEGQQPPIVCSGSADRTLRLWDSHTCILIHVVEHPGIVLSVACSGSLVYTSCKLGLVKVWDVSELVAELSSDPGPRTLRGRTHSFHAPAAAAPAHTLTTKAALLSTLRQFIAFPSVSSQEAHKSACWRCAKYLQAVFSRFNADCRLVQALAGSNPLVLARMGWAPNVPTVVVYGHYDVQPAAKSDGWNTDPFTLTGRDGYFYARGSSDHKGPLLAAIFAAAAARSDLRSGSDAEAPPAHAPELDTCPINFVFVVEGEGEHGSIGFEEAIADNMDWFTGASLLLNNNNTWMGEERPCLTYGLRGCIEVDIAVEGAQRDLHSGVDGGAACEPLADLVAVLATLTEPVTGRIAVPGMAAQVVGISGEERELLKGVELDVERYRVTRGLPGLAATTKEQNLSRRWCEPSLTVHSVQTSATNSSVIPRRAAAKVTIRTVPNQTSTVVESTLLSHVKRVFEARRSFNRLTARATCNAEWWLGNPFAPHYQAAARAVEKHWGVKPMFVREGGSLRVTTLLGAALGVKAIHLPAGQSSDGAHLQNERIRAVNLFRAVDVMQSLFTELAASGPVSGAPSSGAGAGAGAGANGTGASAVEASGAATHKAARPQPTGDMPAPTGPTTGGGRRPRGRRVPAAAARGNARVGGPPIIRTSSLSSISDLYVHPQSPAVPPTPHRDAAAPAGDAAMASPPTGSTAEEDEEQLRRLSSPKNRRLSDASQ